MYAHSQTHTRAPVTRSRAAAVVEAHGLLVQGRWVRQSTELVRSLYSADELVQLALQWVWIPHTCPSPSPSPLRSLFEFEFESRVRAGVYKLFTRERATACLSSSRGSRFSSVHFVGSSMERTIYFELW
jgi:hypothetical protein